MVVAYGVGVDAFTKLSATMSSPAKPRNLADVPAGRQERGLRGMRLVTSDAHAGLKTVIGAELTEASWRRRKVHFMRDVLAHVPGDTRAAAFPSTTGGHSSFAFSLTACAGGDLRPRTPRPA